MWVERGRRERSRRDVDEDDVEEDVMFDDRLMLERDIWKERKGRPGIFIEKDARRKGRWANREEDVQEQARATRRQEKELPTHTHTHTIEQVSSYKALSSGRAVRTRKTPETPQDVVKKKVGFRDEKREQTKGNAGAVGKGRQSTIDVHQSRCKYARYLWNFQKRKGGWGGALVRIGFWPGGKEPRSPRSPAG